MAVLEIGHLTGSGRQDIDNPVQEHLVRQVHTNSIYVRGNRPRRSEMIYFMARIRVIKHATDSWDKARRDLL